MHTNYKNLKIEILNEQSYDIGSPDNIRSYHFKHFDEASKYEFASKYGIVITDETNEISSALICGSGGGTSPHANSFIIKNDSLYICCGQQIYSHSLPSLSLNWVKDCDTATCFGIYELENDFIIHGEMEISRITTHGVIKWQFSARDIFVASDNENAFEVINGLIKLTDWQGYKYNLNGDGVEIS